MSELKEFYGEEKAKCERIQQAIDTLSVVGDCRMSGPSNLTGGARDKLYAASAMLIVPESDIAAQLYRAAGTRARDPLALIHYCALGLEALADGFDSSSTSPEEVLLPIRDFFRRYLRELKNPPGNPDRYDIMAVGAVSRSIADRLSGRLSYHCVTQKVLDLTPEAERERCRKEAARIVGSCVACTSGTEPSLIWPGPAHATIYALAHPLERRSEAYLAWHCALERGEIPPEMPLFLDGLSQRAGERLRH